MESFTRLGLRADLPFFVQHVTCPCTHSRSRQKPKLTASTRWNTHCWAGRIWILFCSFHPMHPCWEEWDLRHMRQEILFWMHIPLSKPVLQKVRIGFVPTGIIGLR